ncbi:synaptotagmin-7-like isoform X2 [Schistocerca gregaria]|uniref:synaptotagmin-7-like isoform X2 n=1 Tax=Schistocerca gregaria TaxID=7010 RepID=UPI00211F263D|nr:synaptotagmin-7-like isoform X2 [Schistocerca gregaria]
MVQMEQPSPQPPVATTWVPTITVVQGPHLVVMERRDVVVTAVVCTVLALLLVGGSLAACYWWRRRKRKREADSDGGGEGGGGGGGSGTPAKERRANGFLSLRTPLISTKALGSMGTSSGSKSGAAQSSSAAGTPGTPGTPGSAGPQGSKGQGKGQGGAGAGAGAGSKGEPSSMAFLQNRSMSMLDMYIDNTESSENVGQIHFSLEYDFQNTTLILRIISGKDLAAKDISGTSDPYVRVTLLPDKKHRLETKIKRRTLNPRWNETFYFEGFPIQKLQSRVLHLHCFDYDRFSRDDSIGEVFLPLCQVDFSEKPSFWKALKPPAKDKCGELLTALCYQPNNSVLTLTLLKARNLKAKDINGKSDPYVKVWLQFGDKRIEKRKTPVYKCTLNPIFDESFSFNVPWEKIRECSLDVQVMDFDNIGRNELIGRIMLAGKNGSGATETKHWQEMITKPRQTVIQWHRLKPE